ncbi:hypothetical protein V6N11_083415 [Hibiscus sabdariffa]|uniref:Uncharacterized protein n=1 Tax=Hibiscus sabdariffa TaxID=183260 RepID=A0ABR2QLT3_9ROSI
MFATSWRPIRPQKKIILQGQRADPDSFVPSSRQGDVVGAVISNLKSVLKLISEMVLLVPECKRFVGLKMTSTSKARQSPLMHFKLLRKLLHSSRSFRRYPQALCQEVFQKVERQFMLGLRAKDPDARRKFFSMYHESLNKTLFTRLHYIIQIQDWETLSDVFWLKQGLDLLLAILVEDKSITVAPNSTRVLPLVAPDSISDSSLMQHHIADVPEGSEEAPLTLDGLVLKNVQFQNEMSRLQILLGLVKYCSWSKLNMSAFALDNRLSYLS